MQVKAARAHVIVVSDRVHSGEREDKASPRAVDMLERAGFHVDPPIVIGEGYDEVATALGRAVREGYGLIITCGGTGLGSRNLTPEATREVVATRIEGLEIQILMRGLENSPQAGLSRGIVGLTSRRPGGALVVNAPSSPGGVEDALSVIISVWPNICERICG